MPHQIIRLSAIGLAAFSLGSCSYGYDILAVVIDGRLAFIVDPASEGKPDCIGSIHVSVDKGGPIAEPVAGDDEGLVRNGGVYWWKSFEIGSCENPFPIFYGQHLKGKPFIYDDGPSTVEAKPLRIGVLYHVDSSSKGGYYASGWFRITEDRRVENLNEDPTPPISNEEGYDVTDYANMAAAPDLGSYHP
jgi:hypothetical protein